MSGKQFYAVVYSGKATVEAAGLTAANYTADIVYRGDDKYSEASTTVNVKVNQKPADKIESIISITEIRGTTIYVVLKDQNGNAIANAVVEYVINGNKQSIITSDDGTFTIEGEKCAILVTGDRGRLGEMVLLHEALLPDVDLLIAGHHGSKNSTSEELLSTVSPEIVYISVGENNNYGHPAPSLLDRLMEFGCEIFRTDQDGTLIFRR